MHFFHCNGPWPHNVMLISRACEQPPQARDANKHPGDDLHELFSAIDENCDGAIDMEEFASFSSALGISNLTQAQLEAEFDSADADANGTINFEEFKCVLVSSRQICASSVWGQAQRGLLDRWLRQKVGLLQRTSSNTIAALQEAVQRHTPLGDDGDGDRYALGPARVLGAIAASLFCHFV